MPVQQEVGILDLFLHSLAETLEFPTLLILVVDGEDCRAARLLVDWASGLDHEAVSIVIAENKRPRGWGRVIDFGFESAVGDAVFVLDSDVILCSQWQSSMLSALRAQPQLGGVGGVLLYPQTGGVQHCGVAFSTSRARHVYLNAPAAAVPLQLFPVQAFVGALSCFRTTAVQEAGSLDPDYFNSYDDLDYCLRLGQRGYELAIVPSARAYHWELSSGVHRDATRRQNLARFWTKWGRALEPDLWRFLSWRLKEIDNEVRCRDRFVGIDLCESRTEVAQLWRTLATHGAAIDEIRDYSSLVSASQEIWLPRVLGRDGHRTIARYLIAVDHFVRLEGNRYWADIRSQYSDADVVVDLYANVVPFSLLAATAWPGRKIR